MPFCSNCGKQISENSKFCASCGKSVIWFTNPSVSSERKTVYDGEIRKCPSCGEVINSFVAICPSCGYELRGTSATTSVQQLYCELNNSNSVEQKTMIIRNYPIPNSKEDIIEFMILASSNIKGESDKNIFEAWMAKFEQAYHKSQMTLQNDQDFSQIESIYKNSKMAITKEKFSHATTTTGHMISRYFKAMPNRTFAIVAVIVLLMDITTLLNGRFTTSTITSNVLILGITYYITEKKNKDSTEEYTNTQDINIYKVTVPSAVIGGTSENYTVVESYFLQAGFTNVKTVPLNDLTFSFTKKVGTVDSITINSKKLSSYSTKKFDAKAPVLITYHSLRK